MARYIGPKTRLSRRIGTRLFPKDEKILTKRNFPPGMHGGRRRRLSGYGMQLMEKQKAKWTYGIFERQFRRYYEQAAKRPGQTGTLLLQLLETRLDNVVFRLGFASTRPQARQLVTHGFFEVNGKKVTIPSYQLKVGDQIAVRQNKQTSRFFENHKNYLATYKPMEWLALDVKSLSGTLLSLPTAETLASDINTRLIIEHYSR